MNKLDSKELVKFGSDYARCMINQKDFDLLLSKAKKLLSNKIINNKDALWFNYPTLISKNLIEEMSETASEIRNISDIIIVCGIGGSYYGAKSAIDFILKEKKPIPEIIFTGNTLNPEIIKTFLEKIKDKNFSVIVISKSGETLETMLTFQIFYNELMLKYKTTAEISKRIIAITEDNNNFLNKFSKKNKNKIFYVPKEINGRFSVFTPAGLFPMLLAGIDINKFLEGAIEQRKEIIEDANNNGCLEYSTYKTVLDKEGKNIELFSYSNPYLFNFVEWLKQLFAETISKKGNGIFPASFNYPSNFHSIEQYVIQGPQNIFETELSLFNKEDIHISYNLEFFNNMENLKGKGLKDLNLCSHVSGVAAHFNAGVPILQISVPEISEKGMGSLFFFFITSAILMAYTINVNPFTQTGIDEYKKNFLKLILR